MNKRYSKVDDLLRVLFRGYFGHKEHTDILRRTAEGIESHIRKGKFAGGVPPFGYQTDEHSRLVVHEPNARIVRMIENLRPQR